MRAHNRNHGVILPVVLLIIAVALTSFMFSAALVSLSARSSATSDRSSTQALLAADSGLQTLPAVSRSVDYNSSISFTQWIESEFGVLDLGDGITATLDVLDEQDVDGNGQIDRVIVQSTGSTGSSTRVIVQAIAVVAGPPVNIAVNVPGALTSVGTIKSNSNSNIIEGRDDTPEAWSFSPVDLCTAEMGEYFEYSSTVYRVEEEPDCSQSVSITKISGDGDLATLAGSTDVQHRPFAVVDYDPNTSKLQVTEASGYLFGEKSPIVVSHQGFDYVGEVESVDETTLTVKWDGTPPPDLQEGTIIRKEVASGVTKGDCDIRLSAFPNRCYEDQPLDFLFESTFGIRPADLKASLPASSFLEGLPVRSDGQPLTDITWLTNPDNNVRNQTGSGILIIENNPGQTIRLNVNNDFTGLIYVIGNADLAGNANYQGAIIVDGEATITTDVQGTMSLYHDPLVLARALSGIKRPNPNAGRLGEPIVNTWRIR